MARRTGSVSWLITDLRTWAIILGLIVLILGYMVAIKRDLGRLQR
jgi:hypothetical protein